MKFNFLVAPDFAPEHFAGWHMLNSVLQSRSGLHLHLQTPASAHEQAQLLQSGAVDLIYANPFDAAALIREQGFHAFARPVNKADEMVIASAAGSAVRRVEDLKAGCRIALTDNRDVRLIGLRLLEAADLLDADVQWRLTDTYQAAARLAIKGDVDCCFLLAETWHTLSRLTRAQLQVVVESAIHDITHVLLAHERLLPHLDTISRALLGVGSQPNDSDVLEALGMPGGFEPMDSEAAEFMVDLMDTLLD